MTHAAKILADSVSPDGVRLTTMEVTFPRIVLAEMNTHRMLSRNSASSRAIPVEKMIRMVDEHSFVPTHWGKNQKGMQAEVEIADERDEAIGTWLEARDHAVHCAMHLLRLGVHKQIANRLLEPFMWHTCIVTATEFSNFFHLRCHRDAHPEIQRAAELMRDAMEKSKPHFCPYGQWHVPLIQMEEAESFAPPELMEADDWEWLCKVSVGRCARVSYLTHDGVRDPRADVELCERLLASGHMSPFEHVARPMTFEDLSSDEKAREVSLRGKFRGNFRGWVQYRKQIPNEHDILGAANA
jgi:thymidylate synthase ThyX